MTPSREQAAATESRGDPFLRRAVTVVFLTFAAALIAAVLVLGIDILLAAFAGVLFAVFLLALADLLARHTPLTNGWALAAVLLLGTAILGAGGAWLAPQVAAQIDEVSEQLPQMLADGEAFLQRYAWGEWILGRAQDGGMADGVGAALGPFVSGTLYSLTILVTIFFVGLFGAANPKLYRDGIVRLFPLRHRPLAGEVLADVGYALRWWLIGRAVAMLMVGVTTFVVLLLFGVRFALLLGIIAGLLTFVPYLGPIAAAVPIVLVSLLEGPQQAFWVFLGYTAIQQVEGNVLDPYIMHKLIYIPPVTTIVMQVLMGVVIGVMGVVMATPLAAVLVVLNRFYRRDLLGDAEAEPVAAGDNPFKRAG
jgi:predicted PurR-regulated permease PerM